MESRIRSLCTSGIIFFVCSLAVAQNKFSNYRSSFFNKTYNISISLKDKEPDIFTLWFNAESFDNLYKDAGLIVAKEDYPAFTKALSSAKMKLEEWTKTAKENNVKSVSKQMSIVSKVAGYFMSGSTWNFQFTVPLTFEFKVVESGKSILYLVVIRSGDIASSKNKFIKMDGVSLVFTSGKEIDDFLNAISMTKINAYIKQPKKEELFK